MPPHDAILVGSRKDQAEPLHIGVRREAKSHRPMTAALVRNEILQHCKGPSVHKRPEPMTSAHRARRRVQALRLNLEMTTGSSVKANSEPMQRHEERAAEQRKEEGSFHNEKPRREREEEEKG